MPTRAFLTVDTELMWRHHAAGLDIDTIAERSLEPAGVGIGYQLRKLAEHDLKATFFVDPMPAVAYGLDPIRRVVGAILEAGQEVQLHLHPNWAAASAEDRAQHASFELIDFTLIEQRELIRAASDLLVAAGAPRPIVDAMNAEMKVWLDDAKTKERFSAMAGFPAYGTPEQFEGFVKAQIAQWKGVIDKEGLKLDVN